LSTQAVGRYGATFTILKFSVFPLLMAVLRCLALHYSFIYLFLFIYLFVYLFIYLFIYSFLPEKHYHWAKNLVFSGPLRL